MNKMLQKILIIFTAVLFVIVIMPVSADEVSVVWAKLYQEADNLKTKQNLMSNIIDLHDRDMIPVLESALDELIQSRGTITNSTDRIYYTDLMKMIVKELGELRATESASRIYRVVIEAEDPFLKGEAIIALGNTGSKSYANKIADVLKNINLGVTIFNTNKDIETVVSSCVLALERMKQTVGFKPVFIASIGRYSRTVTKRAERALENMVEDPSEMLTDVILSEPSFDIKLKALEVEDKSNAPDDMKVKVAVEALKEGLKYKTDENREKKYLSRIRTKSAEMLRDLRFDNTEAVFLLEDLLYKDYDINEKLTGIEALGANSSDESAMVLSDFLKYQNDRQSEGVTAKDDRVIKETIRAIKNTGNKICIPELIRVEYCDWTNTIIRASKDALEALQ